MGNSNRGSSLLSVVQMTLSMCSSALADNTIFCLFRIKIWADMDLKPIFLYPMGAGGQSCVFREPGWWIYPVTCSCLGRLGYVGLRWVMLGYADGTLNLSLIVRTWQHPPRRRLWRNKMMKWKKRIQYFTHVVGTLSTLSWWTGLINKNISCGVMAWYLRRVEYR